MDSLYTESAYYRMLFAERTQDLPFYRRVTAGGEREVLELGVGDGRVALALAADERRMVGVDSSASMLATLEARLADAPTLASRVEAHLGDSTTFRLGRRVPRVICPFNGIAHFHDHEALGALFETVRAHLEPDEGRFAFDVMIPDPALLAGGASSVPWLRHPRTGAVCRMEESYVYDTLSQVLTITTTLIDREREERQTLSLRLRQLFPEETRLLLEHHGFEVLERSTEIGDSLAYLCRRRA